MTGIIQDVQNILKWFWMMQILNVSVLMQNGNLSIDVYTYMPFSSENCEDTRPILINQFINETYLKTLSEIFPTKTSNLNGCEVRIATSNTSLPYIFAQKLRNGSLHLYGRDIKLVTTLSEALKFRINYTYIGREGFIFENGTAGGHFMKLLENKADLAMGDSWLIAYRLKFFDSSVSYFSQQLALIIPPGAQLTTFEKFTRPLDFVTWLLLVLFIGVAFVAIFVIRKTSLKCQELVFGEGVKNPSMNILVAIFGGSQLKLPTKNFARFILMMFLILCLVMRTLYTGSLYRFLQSKIYHKEVQSINEMAERGYKVYYLDYMTDLIIGAQSQLNER
jgi:hypothetical protein